MPVVGKVHFSKKEYDIAGIYIIVLHMTSFVLPCTVIGGLNSAANTEGIPMLRLYGIQTQCTVINNKNVHYFDLHRLTCSV